MNFIKIEEAYKNIYLQFPVALLYNEKYKNLSDSAKIAYIIFTDRFKYSIKNNWIDDNGYIYFIYTNDELKKLLNCSKDKVIKIKKELENKKLLYQVKVGLNKPNRLYLGSLEVNANEVFLPGNDPQSLENKGSRKNRLPENNPQSLENKGSRKNRLNLYINNLDTLQDTLLDTGNDDINLNEYAKQIEAEIDTIQTNSIPEPAKQTLLTFSFNDYKMVEEQIGMIYRAKKDINKKYNVNLLIENDEYGFINMIKTISLAIYKDKKSVHKIKNYDNYFYTSIKNYFALQAEKELFKQEIQHEILPEISMYNWLD